ncbi:hypothetical protein [Streptomyces sp. NPDC059092]|uniref:hypothetical protein n=1 Tax=Streptomyces sp. NPDC059092 TaxID=3346725 RepID=UPI003697022D
MENVVRDGIARGGFRDVRDVRLAVESLSGVMCAGAEHIGRDPAAFEAAVRSARKIVLASPARRPGQYPPAGLRPARPAAGERTSGGGLGTRWIARDACAVSAMTASGP